MFIGNPVNNFNVANIDQRMKMKRGKNNWNIEGGAKWDYEIVRNNVKSDK